MSTTPFMNLELPTVSVTLGPEWAEDLNAALALIDSHDHSEDKGTRVKTAGLNINADLTFNSFSAFGLKSLQLDTQSATLTGATYAQSLFSYGGDLYFTSGAGAAVQLTAGGSIIPTPSAVSALSYSPITSDTVLTAADTVVVLGVSTTSSRTITLPSAATVAAGRIFWIKDQTGNSETNPITILPDGLDVIDGTGSVSLSSNYGAAFFITNGVDTWMQL